MRKRLTPLIALLLILAVVAVAYSVAIALTSADIDQLGATDTVDVYCPASGCKINRVKWILTSSAPYMLDRVQIEWQTASSTGSYTVYVELYDNSNPPALKSSGSATQPGSGAPVTTIVDVGDVDPKDVYKVRIVIVQN